MRSRYLFLVAGLIFLALAGAQLFHGDHGLAAAASAIAGAIFLYLGIAPPRAHR